MNDASCPTCGADLRPTALYAGDLYLDTRIRAARWKGHDIHFAPQEAKVVELLVRRAGKAVSKWSIHELCLGGESEIKIVDVYVCKARGRFRSVDPDFDLIQTIWGEGYVWNGPAAVDAEIDPETAKRARIAKARAEAA